MVNEEARVHLAQMTAEGRKTKMLPTPALPESFLPDDLPLAVRERLVTLMRPWKALSARSRKQRPDEGSSTETALLTDFMALIGREMEVFEEHPDLIRSGVQHGLEELVREELDAAETERKLALRLLQDSLDVFADMSEFWREQITVVPDDEVVAAIREASDAVRAHPKEHLVGDVRTILRWQLDLFVALDIVDGALDELTYWARRAIIGSRATSAALKRMVAEVAREAPPDERYSIRYNVVLSPEGARDVLDLIAAQPGPNAKLQKLFDDATHPAS